MVPLAVFGDRSPRGGSFASDETDESFYHPNSFLSWRNFTASLHPSTFEKRSSDSAGRTIGEFFDFSGFIFLFSNRSENSGGGGALPDFAYSRFGRRKLMPSYLLGNWDAESDRNALPDSIQGLLYWNFFTVDLCIYTKHVQPLAAIDYRWIGYNG